jgi:LAO/AO transport system kinase
LQTLAAHGNGWIPPIVKTVASEGKGIEDLASAIGRFKAHLQKEDLALKRTIHNWEERIVEMLRDSMLEKARTKLDQETLSRYAAEVAEHKRDPYTLVEDIANLPSGG